LAGHAKREGCHAVAWRGSNRQAEADASLLQIAGANLHIFENPFRKELRDGSAIARRVAMSTPPRFIYILESLSEPARHYTGLSSDVAARLAWHNAGLSTHTAKYRPWRLLVTMEFADTDMAVRFETYLKSGSGRAFARRHFSRLTAATMMST
jgi:predicted GIY-YIG superfamily endonuclease